MPIDTPLFWKMSTKNLVIINLLLVLCRYMLSKKRAKIRNCSKTFPKIAFTYHYHQANKLVNCSGVLENSPEIRLRTRYQSTGVSKSNDYRDFLSPAFYRLGVVTGYLLSNNIVSYSNFDLKSKTPR